ncbi:MAG: transposase, partial [Cyanobacteria bacterium J06628_4]
NDKPSEFGNPVETFHGTSLPDSPPRHQPPWWKLSPQNGSLSLSKTMSAISPKRGSLGAIVRSYKSSVTRHCRQNGYSHFAWQPRFYEHIIRADGSIEYIRRYIVNNPRNWQRDRNNVRKLSPPTPPR